MNRGQAVGERRWLAVGNMAGSLTRLDLQVALGTIAFGTSYLLLLSSSTLPSRMAASTPSSLALSRSVWASASLPRLM